jgi:hypothetical protein
MTDKKSERDQTQPANPTEITDLPARDLESEEESQAKGGATSSTIGRTQPGLAPIDPCWRSGLPSDPYP